MAAGAEHGQLAQAEVHVKELEDLEDYYFEADRQSKMEAAAAKVVECVKRAFVNRRSPPKDLNARGFFLRGRALSFLPDKESEAEELLSKAIKLDPKLLGAWNALGEVHWNMQKYQRARECFEHALEFCGANAVSLRSLSMVLRAVDTEAEASGDEVVAERRAANFAGALEKAKAAVALDASDPQNWETLGNAYVGDFFVNARRPDELNRALIAYGKAEAAYGKLGKSSHSLQLNRGMAAKYIEDYELAIRCFRKAQETGAANSAQEAQKVMELVQRLAGYAQRKGDLKVKQLKELLEDFKKGDDAHRSLRDLRTKSGSVEAPLAAKVVTIVDRQEELPMIIICCDAFGDFFALSLYSAQSSKVADAIVPMKSILHIQKADFRDVSVTANHKSWCYPCVRVGHPGDVTVVGSGSLGSAAALSKFSAAAHRRELPAEASSVAPAAEDAHPPSSRSAERTQAEDQVDAKQEKWIEEEDAKMRKENAKAKAKAKPAAKGKAKRKNSGEKIVARKFGLEAISNVGKHLILDAEIETNTGSEALDVTSVGSESCLDMDKDAVESQTVEDTVEESVEFNHEDTVESQTAESNHEDTPPDSNLESNLEDIVESLTAESRLHKPSPVRWSDLGDSSDDESLPRGLPREVVARLWPREISAHGSQMVRTFSS